MPFFLAPILINILIGLALSLASTLIESIFKQDQKQKVAGVRGTIQTGGDNSPSFIVGRYATAGKLKYAGTWGNDGETPNAFYSKVVETSFLPIRGYAGWFINGERVTLAPGVTGDLGYAVLKYRDDAGKDHAWIKPYLGAQTVADPLMRAKFGADVDRPYTATMVGRGLGYFVATFLVNRELFSGLPEVLAEVDGIALSDPRGDNAHDNPIIAAYTLLKGLSYGGQWVYGPQSYSDYNFRLTNIESEADKCDAARSLSGGGTEKRFRIGLEVSLDAEPHAIVGEFLKGCQGRWADVGGVFKFLVGDPGSPVVSITDEDIVITEQQTFEPFPGLENLFNAMTATYPEPAEAWETKEAPPRYRSDLEASDDGRRLPFSTDYKAVPYAVQVQELMRAAIEETRRFRRHTMTMPPEWWEYEVLDVASWSSLRNGYENKQFLITAMDDLPNVNQFVGMQEMDPADYDWESDYQLPYDVVPLVIARPEPQITTGFTASPYTVVDNLSHARRAAIQVFWDAGLVDVRNVLIEIRESWGAKKVIAEVTLDYDLEVLSPSRVVSNPAILPNKTYEVRGYYAPFSGRIVRWSNQNSAGVDGAWISVTTPNVLLGIDDLYPISQEQLDAALQADQAWIRGGIRDVRASVDAIVTKTVDQDFANFADKQQLRTELTTRAGEIETSYTLLVTTAIGEVNGAIQGVSQRVETLEVAFPDLATITAVNAIDLRVTAAEGSLVVQGDAIAAINAVLPGKADTTVTDALAVRVTDNESGLSTHGQSLRDVRSTIYVNAMGGVEQDFANFRDKGQVLEATANVYQYAETQITAVNGSLDVQAALILAAQTSIGTKASAEALLALDSRVGLTPAGYSSFADAFLGVSSTVDGITGSSRVRFGTGYTPAAGWTVRLGMEVRIGTSDSFKAGGFYFEATTSAVRAIWDADQLVVKTGSTIAAVFDSGTTFLAKARIRDLDAANIDVIALVASTAFVNNLVVKTANIENLSVDGTKILPGAVSLDIQTSFSIGSGGGTYNSGTWVAQPVSVGSSTAKLVPIFARATIAYAGSGSVLTTFYIEDVTASTLEQVWVSSANTGAVWSGMQIFAVVGHTYRVKTVISGSGVSSGNGVMGAQVVKV